jgi:NAD(P)-dependent dehydrogenase (short-subunit alcohol dehydrogenase family)
MTLRGRNALVTGAARGIGRGTPEDVAQAVLDLASAPNVTGVALDVAGGMEVW